ncbi:MAG TPA: sigma-54 dependent transcriptional regulator [Polyangia bacterium]|nr:sigma-54 dependent transcriptional regulator [Polyangia bacterium]
MPDRAHILIVDDNLEMARTLADGLSDNGYDATAVSAGGEAIVRLEAGGIDAVVTDLRMPNIDGLAVLEASRRLDPARPVIIMTAFSAIDTAVESIRRGANHYLTKPFKQDELYIFLGRALEEVRLRREAAALKRELGGRFAARAIVGESTAIRAIRELVVRVADAPAPVLIRGETGTGKGLVARAIHAESGRAAGPFVSINCAAIPEGLLESELFGYVRGAFTGAARDHGGLYAEARGGTLFLDEIGEMVPALQAKLLHVIESGSVRPVGGTREVPVDARILAATNRNLAAAVRDGKFREDLLYRLDVVSIALPALRDRREDLPQLAAHLLTELRGRYPKSPVERVGAEALALLARHAWPGNVRELSHVLERIVLLGRRPEIGVDDLPDSVRDPAAADPLEFRGEILPIRELQRRYAAWALTQTGGHRAQAAEKLGIDVKTLRGWLE